MPARPQIAAPARRAGTSARRRLRGVAPPPPPTARGWGPRSRPPHRAENRNRDRLSGADIDAFDVGPAGVAQADRLGALREAPFLARLDEGKAALPAAQELGGAGGIGQAGRP